MSYEQIYACYIILNDKVKRAFASIKVAVMTCPNAVKLFYAFTAPLIILSTIAIVFLTGNVLYGYIFNIFVSIIQFFVSKIMFKNFLKTPRNLTK